MTEVNIYATYQIPFSFQTNPQAYLTIKGFSGTPTPPDPDKIFEYTPYYPITAASVILCAENIIPNGLIHTTILDQNNTPIPGTEAVTSDVVVMKSVYTFDTPVQPGTTIRFSITSSGLDSVSTYVFCNATIFG